MFDKRCVVFGGHITSKNDRKRHYIIPHQVAKLYPQSSGNYQSLPKHNFKAKD